MSSSLDTPVGRKKPRTRLETQRVPGGSDDDSVLINQTQQETEGEWSAIPDLTDSHSDEDQSEHSSFCDIWEEDNMPYPY